ncbi:MAG: outer membrane beta-barrel family protein [Saprospiraceae bacterium]
MKPLFYLSLLFLSFHIQAQSITGVLSDSGNPVSFANVLLYNAVDTTIAKFTYSEDNGSFHFDNVKAGQYFIKATFVGLADYQSAVIESTNNSTDVGTMEMSPSGQQLAEVTVTAKKPLMEVKPDKLVLNVAGSVLATGDDALSLLRKAPGVTVDNNDKISLLGKTGLVIYIDGKPSPLTSTELATMLRNMSSNDIESIEIISNPSAKYDAQGTAGIINIKRKKINTGGLNGTATLTARQGLTSGLNTGLNLNYRNQKFNLFGSAGYFNSNNRNYNDFYRAQNNLGFTTYNVNENNSTGINTKVSGDYYLDKKSTIGFIAELNSSDFNMDNTSITRLGNLRLTEVDSLLLNNGNNVAKTTNNNFNVNYYYDGGNETTFNIDANYGRFDKENDAYTPNQYTTPDRSRVTSTYEVRILTPTTIDIANIKMDYERKLGKAKISAGLKSAMVQTGNAFNFFNIADGKEVLNDRLSNRFTYDEWVHAIYTNYNIQIKKWGVNVGLRVENSNTTGNLIAMQSQNDKVVKRKYTDIFPSAGLSFSPSQKHAFQLSYGRRINRPNYQDLNPFESQLDQLTFEKGNAFLNPEYTDNIQLVHTFAQKLNTTLSYSHTNNVITRLVDTSGLKGTFITWDNIAFRKVYSLGLSMPFSFTEKWSTFTNINGVHTQNRANFGDGKTISINVSSFNFYHQETFSLPKSWSVEASGWYSSPSIWEGTFLMKSMWAMGAGVSKKLAGNKGKVTLTIDDIFKTNIWRGESTFGGLFMDISGGWDSRRVRLTFSYNFGKSSNAKSRRRSTGLEDEQKRIKS